jgi:Ca2+-binding RTX toxin-like protein
MPSFFLITGYSSAPQTLEDDSTGIVTATGTMHVEGAAVTLTGDADLFVNGTVIGQQGVTIARTGDVFVGSTGSIHGQVGYGIDITGYAGERRIVNEGTIQGASSGIGWAFITIDQPDVGFRLTNTGSIVGVTSGVSGTYGGAGTYALVNAGFIRGDQAVIIQSVNTPSQTATVTNSGTIAGTTSGLLGAFGDEAISNTGVISVLGLSDTRFAVDLGAGNDLLVNAGQIVGNVRLGDGNDRFDGLGGQVTGTVAGGSGNDLYILDDATIRIIESALGGTDTIRSAAEGFALPENVEALELIGNARAGYGSTLADTIRGNLHDNVLGGRAGNDTVEGGEGRDSLYGGDGNDSLRGENGDDYIRGGPGDDILGGGDGADFLQGSEGADSLYGGFGQDRLWGGIGPDVLWGGADADTFTFGWVAESPGGVGRDRIMDLQRGTDLIDLSRIDANALAAGNQAFQFIGTAAFTAAGQVRYAVVGPDVIVGADVDGDGVGDLTILVAGVAALTANDFLL